MAPRKKAIQETEEIKLPCFKVSVRALVAFSIPEDTTWSFSSYAQAQEGSLLHTEIQGRHLQDGGYDKEVYLAESFPTAGCIVEVSGRADGIWTNETEVIIHEIKSTSTQLAVIDEDFSEAHWAQVKCYAYMHALQNKLDKVSARLTYVHRATKEEKSFDRTYTLEKLKRFFKTLIFPFAQWALAQAKWRELRNLSIQALNFPFSQYRKGQKLLAYNVWQCINDKKRLFAQAPTGTGKTMGVLYPAIKALAEKSVDRIFYLTAKTTTRGIAESAYKALAQQGLRLRTLTLTAKEKLCLNTVKNCNPEKCLYIQGFESRSKKAVKELIKETDFYNRDLIIEKAMSHNLCPFEFSLDLALQCDLIICDYNYVFDPRINLKRFFQQRGRENHLFLVDEAHNLFDRAREIYSATLEKAPLIMLSRDIRIELPVIGKTLRELFKKLTALEKQTTDQRVEAGGTFYYASDSSPSAIVEAIQPFIMETEQWMMADNEERPYTEALISAFFDLLHFKNIMELYSDAYRTLITGSKSSLRLQLMCLDPRSMLHESMEMSRSTILFSATLSPLSYYRDILGGRPADVTLRLPSPFPREHLLVINEDCVETRFKYRQQYLDRAARTLYDWVRHHQGNYLVFFPSYRYLSDVLQLFLAMEGDFEILCQQREMDEASREEFLKEFDTYGDTTRIGFCVLGGIFGEGIDLTGDRLTGVAIVGVGLPQVCPELEIMRNYYQEKLGTGYEYAYVYPGINRVLQASGRLIRTENDKGALLLIDSRFSTQAYLSILPDEWLPILRTSQGHSIEKNTRVFWDPQ